MNLHVSETALASNARRRKFHERISAIHAYKVMKGVDPSPFWPGMWMWDLVEITPKRPQIRVDAIIDAVCDHYDVSRPELLSLSRHAYAVRARHVFCYLARKMTRLSFEQIGRKISRDHTTTLYAFKKIKEESRVDQLLASQIATITRGLS